MKNKLRKFLEKLGFSSNLDAPSGSMGFQGDVQRSPLTTYEQQIIPARMVDGINERFIENHIRQQRQEKEEG